VVSPSGHEPAPITRATGREEENHDDTQASPRLAGIMLALAAASAAGSASAGLIGEGRYFGYMEGFSGWGQ
jgi:hypothetical protein